jgi:hypothetical protein
VKITLAEVLNALFTEELSISGLLYVASSFKLNLSGFDDEFKMLSISNLHDLKKI